MPGGTLDIYPIALIAGAAAGVLIYVVARWLRAGPSGSDRWLFGLLAGVVSFIVVVLLFLFIGLGAVPTPGDWLYPSLHPVYIWFERIPIIPIAIGLLFGSLASEWIWYILLPVELKTDELDRAHSRWGYALLAALILGGVYPYILGALTRSSLNSASVGPTGVSLSFSAKDDSNNPRIGAPSSDITSNQIVEDSPPYAAAPLISIFAKRDQKLAKYYLLGYLGDPPSTKSESAATLPAPDQLTYNVLKDLHSKADPLVSKILAPMGECLSRHYEKFHSPRLIHERLAALEVAYVQALPRALDPKAETRFRKTLVRALRKLASDLGQGHIDSPESAAARGYGDTCAAAAYYACELGASSPEAAKVLNGECPGLSSLPSTTSAPLELDDTLPYASMGLAYLFYAGGDREAAALELKRWVDTQFNLMDADRPKGCGKNEKSSNICLPYIYETRILFDLSQIMSTTSDNRVTYLLYKNTIDIYNRIFRHLKLKSAPAWMQKCATNSDPDIQELQERLVSAYYSQVWLMVIKGLDIAINERPDNEGIVNQPVSDEILQNAKQLSDIKESMAHCIDDSILGSQGKEHVIALYVVADGLARAQAAIFESHTSELDKLRRRDNLRDARSLLEEGIDDLRRDAAERSDRCAPFNLFCLTETDKFVRRANRKLYQVRQILGESGPD